MVLVMAVILLTVVALSAFQLSSWANSSLKIAVAIKQQIDLRIAMQSGVSQLCVRLREQGLVSEQTGEDPQSVYTMYAGGDHERITITACRPLSSGSIEPREYGFADESAKLDVNWLASLDPKAGRQRLLRVPGMTIQAADSILDWIDSDHEPREFGAERNYYISRRSQSLPPNTGISSLMELVPVRQVTYAELFGTLSTDINETSSDSGNASRLRQSRSSFERNALSDQPWSQFLTVFAAEEDASRAKGIPLNSSDLKTVYESVEKELGEEAARYVLAVRLFGIKQRQVEAQRKTRQKSVNERIAEQLNAGEPQEDRDTDPELKSLGGFDASGGARWRIESFYDLIGTFVVPTQGSTRHKVLRSPWQGGNQAGAELLLEISEVLSLAGDQPRRGRLNINEAPAELLRSLPDINETQIKKLLSVRQQRVQDARSPHRRTTEWLLTENVADLDLVRKWGPYITGRGDVLTGDIFAFADSGSGPVLTCRVSLSTASQPPQVLYADSTQLLPGAARKTLP